MPGQSGLRASVHVVQKRQVGAFGHAERLVAVVFSRPQQHFAWKRKPSYIRARPRWLCDNLKREREGVYRRRRGGMRWKEERTLCQYEPGYADWYAEKRSSGKESYDV
eukprot:926304-Rhodomonas_salina.2